MPGRAVQIVKINDEDTEHSFTLGKLEIYIDYLTVIILSHKFFHLYHCLMCLEKYKEYIRNCSR